MNETTEMGLHEKKISGDEIFHTHFCSIRKKIRHETLRIQKIDNYSKNSMTVNSAYGSGMSENSTKQNALCTLASPLLKTVTNRLFKIISVPNYFGTHLGRLSNMRSRVIKLIFMFPVLKHNISGKKYRLCLLRMLGFS